MASDNSPNALDRCDTFPSGQVDDACGEGRWHIEEMGSSYALVVGEVDDRVIFDIRAECGAQVGVTRAGGGGPDGE